MTDTRAQAKDAAEVIADAIGEDYIEAETALAAARDALAALEDAGIYVGRLEQVGFFHDDYGFEGMKHGIEGDENSGSPVFRKVGPQ